MASLYGAVEPKKKKKKPKKKKKSGAVQLLERAASDMDVPGFDNIMWKRNRR
jgi:hypothetical protein